MALVVYKYCNPYKEDDEYKEFTIKGNYVRLYQDKSKGIGNTFWDSVRISLFTNVSLLYYLTFCRINIREIGKKQTASN